METLTPIKNQCTAKARSGERCQRRPSKGYKVCRMHGAATPKGPALPQYTDGKQSRWMYLPQNLTPRFETLTKACVDDLDESWQIQKTLETEILELMAGTEDADERAKYRREIQSIHDTQRKLAETASKIRKEQQDIYTQEQWNAFHNVVMQVLRKRLEAKALMEIIGDLEVYQRKELKA